jgi:hypothetical protein
LITWVRRLTGSSSCGGELFAACAGASALDVLAPDLAWEA